MLLSNLRKAKEVSRMTYEQIAEASKTPLSTVKRIFSEECEPLASTLHRIAGALNVSLDDLLADTNVVLSPKTLVEVQEIADVAEAERDLVAAENAILKDKVAALTAEVDLLKMQLAHKDELLAVHNFYGKLIPHN